MAINSVWTYTWPLSYRTIGTSKTTSTVPSPRSVSTDLPTAQVGIPVPYIHGRRLVSEPNIIWYGNPQIEYETVVETIEEEWTEPANSPSNMDVSYVYRQTKTIVTQIPIGFRVDMALGICLGPDVRLREIWSDDQKIWEGNIGGYTTGQFGVNDTAYSQCQFAFHNGNFDQAVDPWMSAQDSDMNAYVGIAYIVIRGLKFDKRLGSLRFEVERFSNPLGLTNNRNRQGDDINPATAIYEAMVSRWGGAGLDPDLIDTASFQAAATIFANENHFCSVFVDKESKALGVIGVLQDQTYSMLYQDPSTGKIGLKPIRQETVVYADVEKFGRSNIMAMRSFEKTSWAETYENVRGIYVERTNFYEPTPVLVQNISNANRINGKRSATIEYPYITKAELAMKLTTRDLAYLVTPTYKMSITVNRDGATVKPGDIVLVDWPDFSFWGTPMVVRKVRVNPRPENTVNLELTQFNMPSIDPLVDNPVAPFDPNISFGPTPPPSALIVSAPYYILERAGLVNPSILTNQAYPLMLATPASDAQLMFSAWITNMPGYGKTEIRMNMPYASMGILSEPVSKYDGFEDGELSSIILDTVINPTSMRDQSPADMRKAVILVFIGNEILTFEEAVEIGPRRWELRKVKRALFDTVAESHAAGARVYVTQSYAANISPVGFSIPLGYLPNFRMTSGTINADSSYETGTNHSGWTPGAARTMLPVRPADTRIEGERPTAPFTVVAGLNYDITWKNRRRNTNEVKYQSDSAEPAEAYSDTNLVHFKIYLRDSGGTLRLLHTTSTSTLQQSATVTIPEAATAGAGNLFVRAVNQFGESMYDDALPITVWKGSDLIARYSLIT